MARHYPGHSAVLPVFEDGSYTVQQNIVPRRILWNFSFMHFMWLTYTQSHPPLTSIPDFLLSVSWGYSLLLHGSCVIWARHIIVLLFAADLRNRSNTTMEMLSTPRQNNWLIPHAQDFFSYLIVYLDPFYFTHIWPKYDGRLLAMPGMALVAVTHVLWLSRQPGHDLLTVRLRTCWVLWVHREPTRGNHNTPEGWGGGWGGRSPRTS